MMTRIKEAVKRATEEFKGGFRIGFMRNAKLKLTKELKNGMSGGGIFDQYGTYHSVVLNPQIFSQYIVFRIKELLLLSNPNYFN